MLRTRHFVFWGLGALVLGLYLWTDPDKDFLQTRMLLLGIALPTLWLGVTYVFRKGMFDYIDLGEYARKALGHPIGAGLVFLGVTVFMAFVFLVLGMSSARAQVPEQAKPYLPVLAAEIDAHWPQAPSRPYFGALVHHESACAVSARKCWNPKTKLDTPREFGLGFGQLTKAFRPDGSVRFDKLSELRETHPALAALDWRTFADRPDLQLRAMVIMVRVESNRFRSVPDAMERLHFADAAYNGGGGGTAKERRACAMRSGCDPDRWRGHVELVCLKSRAPLYGNRSACDINRHHVHDVLHVQLPKYRGYL